MTAPEQRVTLAGLTVADPPAQWRALGFSVAQDRVILGGVKVSLGGAGRGITGWTLRNVPPGDIDGLPTSVIAAPSETADGHPNGAVAIDHVVIFTPDFDRTAAVLAERGMELRRIRQAGDRRQGFRRLGPTIMELVESPEASAPGFWGLTIVVSDLEALAREHAHVGPPRPAVQPGRHIATVDAAAGLSTRLALMDPQ
jgi:catechol 2,3-dioxygenase-like lactoylglutathione lyase family enzyme